MIKLLQTGRYTLKESKGKEIILTMDRVQYTCINYQETVVFLKTRHKPNKTEHFLTVGQYRLYKVKDEPDLQNGFHLELHVGEGIWQGYKMPEGMPKDRLGNSGIVPTDELITKVTG